MFVGHGVLAFAIVVAVGRRLEWRARRILPVALVGLAFGTLPDIDMLYAPAGLLSGFRGVIGASDAFWAAAAVSHRSVTHSLVIGLLLTVVVGLWWLGSRGRRDSWGPRTRWARGAGSAGWAGYAGYAASGGIGLAMVAGAFTVSGGLAAVIMTAFVLGGLALASVAVRYDVGGVALVGAAAVGLLSHPFGDVFTGAPPALFYPFDIGFLEARVLLHGDPTINLMLVFFIELAVLWLGVFALADLRGFRIGWEQNRPAALGLGYAAAVLVIPAPSIDTAALFVFSILAVGLVGLPVTLRGRESGRWHGLVTALAAVTYAGVAYLGAYLLVG